MLKPSILLGLLLVTPALAQSSNSAFSSSSFSSSSDWDDSDFDVDVDFPEFPAIPPVPALPAIPAIPAPTPGPSGGSSSSNSTSASCSGGVCTVTVNGQTKTYPGSSLSVQLGGNNGQTKYQIFVDGKLVDQR